MKEKDKKQSGIYIPIILFIGIGVILGLIISFTGAVIVEKTGDKNFCTSCHSMQAMKDSYSMDIHGGAGKHGIEVTCVNCHLPHDSVSSYLIEKVKTGTHDFYVENFNDSSKIDWQEKRRHRESFTFDSACMNCHTNLKRATESNLKAINAHRKYFAKTTTKTCVGCHENVGHKNLGLFLKNNKTN